MQSTSLSLPSRWLRLLVTPGLAVWSAGLFVHLWKLFVYSAPAHDQSWYLYIAQHALSGAELYGPQIVETNPPMNIWFSMLPASLANLLHLDPILMLKLIVLAAMAGSMAWCWRILRAAGLDDSPAFPYLALCSILSALLFLHGFDVGQREHLLVIFILPYVFSVACVDRLSLPLAERLAVGLVGGLAVCFKPQQVLILIGLEIVLVLRSRSLRRLVRPELLSAMLAILVYVSLVVLLTPYVQTMVPLLRDTYWGYGSLSLALILRRKAGSNIILLLALGILVAQRQRLRYGSVSGAFLACSVASAIAFYAQHTGWLYQAYPFDAFLLLAVLWIVLDIASSYTVAWRPSPAFAATALVLTFALLGRAVVKQRYLSSLAAARKPYLETVLARYAPQTPVLVLSTSLDAFGTVFQDHLVWASRFPGMWMLPAIVQSESAYTGGPAPRKFLPPQTVDRLAALERGATVEDLRRWKPAVILVRQCHIATPCLGLEGREFDLAAWFLKSADFAAEWSKYRLQASQQNLDVYTRVP